MIVGGRLSRPMPPECELYGESIWFDVQVKKPFGVLLVDHPDGPGCGVGVGEIIDGGSLSALLDSALARGACEQMWVQEGDELVQVNGEPTDGDRDTAFDLIDNGPEEMPLTFSRRRKGAIKVVFPDGKSVTAPRGAKLIRLANKVG